MTVTPLIASAAATTLLALAVWSCVRAARPRRRTVADVRSILHPAQHGAPPSSTRAAMTESITGAVARTVERRLGTGLELAGLTAMEVAARLVATAAVVAVTSGLVLATGVMLGVLPGPWSLVAVPMLVGASVWTVFGSVRRTVHVAERELRRTTNDVVQLLAVGLTTDQSVEVAFEFALGVGQSAMFTLLRDDVAAAPLRGVSLWEAVDEIGRRTGQRELCELATAIERQGTQGVSISETVSTLARSMRERVLADLERDADRANANLAGPTVAFVCTTLLFLAYPLAMRISEAFTGT